MSQLVRRAYTKFFVRRLVSYILFEFYKLQEWFGENPLIFMSSIYIVQENFKDPFDKKVRSFVSSFSFVGLGPMTGESYRNSHGQTQYDRRGHVLPCNDLCNTFLGTATT